MRLYDENLASIQSFATSKALCCQDYCNVYIKKYSYGFFYALRFGNKLVREKISKMKRKWRENETNKKSLAYIIMIHEMNAWPLNPSNQPASQPTYERHIGMCCCCCWCFYWGCRWCLLLLLAVEWKLLCIAFDNEPVSTEHTQKVRENEYTVLGTWYTWKPCENTRLVFNVLGQIYCVCFSVRLSSTTLALLMPTAHDIYFT